MYINEKLKSFWHGGDYNPDQWLKYPEVLKKDIELMKKSGCNAMSVGIFAWSMLEPEEGVFNFEWLDKVINDLYDNGVYTVLATPSGAMPAWMAEKYPEIRRVGEDGIRKRYGVRHNNCFSSPVYREKVRIINTKLAERYSDHPGILLWHLSNEYNVDDCHCELCKANFRKWLQKKYETVENLNDKWWNGFWSHRVNSFEQIDPPGGHGEYISNPLRIEWHRFKNDLLLDFVQNEIDAVRSVNPNVPVNTNYMDFWDIDYAKLAHKLDVVSWDNYPMWHNGHEGEVAKKTAMNHSLLNSFKKDRPFMMMESSPSATNWQPVCKLRRPGMHLLSSMQAVAHGSDTVQYFQWRKSRGQSEQFHGAVVGHDNSEDTRVFRDVTSVGQALKDISEVTGSLTDNEVAILFDYDNLWSIDIANAYRNLERYKGLIEVMNKHYGALWDLNIGCDFVFEHDDLSRYKAVIVPMLFMLKGTLKEKIEKYVENGGTFVSTFCSGAVDEYGLAFFDKECYPFRKLLGVKAEETDTLYDGESNLVELYGKTYRSGRYCELAYAEGAEVIGVYSGEEFYKGMPAVTVNNYGKGKAYYIATDFDTDGYSALYKEWFGSLVSADKIVDTPENVSVTMRYSQNDTYVFVMNFSGEEKQLEMPFKYEVLSGEFGGEMISPYGTVVLKKIK